MTPLSRRVLMRSAAASLALPVLARAGHARAEIGPDGVALLVGGPAGGALDHWASLLAPPIGHALPGDRGLRRVPTGGLDGVTAANQFEAQAVPDGDTACLLPGAAPLAWLIGDPRVHFDPRGWLPMLAVIAPSVIALRLSATKAPVSRPRLAISGTNSPDLAALIALTMLGLDPRPVWLPGGGVGQPDDAAEAALVAGRVDALLLRGRNLTARLAALPAGVRPFCALSAEVAPARGKDPADFVELHQELRGTEPSGALYDALRATTAAGRLEAGLVLPALTPAARAAQWHQASADVAASLAMQQVAMDAGVQLAGPQQAAGLLATIAVHAEARVALRGFIGTLHPA